ncbi:MAG: ImmA/IrrE family metallo-endopeptidase [Gammaproteobacteria bacterium]|nr:ImmA/IrrE family metallo-endopeptidase [Gammaproteobacteria bacterium]
MARPDDSTLTLVQIARVRKEAERALRQSNVLGTLPTAIDEIMRVAKVREVEEDFLNPSFIAKLMHRVGQTGLAIKQAVSKVIGLFHATEGLVFIDRSLMMVRQRFVRLHESAHGFLPWQRPMYALVQDSEESLDPDTADLFDREANVFASEVLFQLDKFRDMAEEQPFDIFTPVRLAPKFNASVYAAIRQYVSKNHRSCAVVVLNMPELIPGDGFRVTLRRVVASESFKLTFAGRTWAEVYTPDDDIGRLVPLAGKKACIKRSLALTDANGMLHDCVAESFTTGKQVFVLIHVANVLNVKRILFSTTA